MLCTSRGYNHHFMGARWDFRVAGCPRAALEVQGYEWAQGRWWKQSRCSMKLSSPMLVLIEGLCCLLAATLYPWVLWVHSCGSVVTGGGLGREISPMEGQKILGATVWVHHLRFSSIAKVFSSSSCWAFSSLPSSEEQAVRLRSVAACQTSSFSWK